MTRSSLLVCVLLGLLPDPASSQNFELMYQQACAGGELVSCNVLGLMYLTGEGVTRDPARALPLYMRACDGGLSGACINLGVMYQTGEGVTQNLARAAELYERACSSGDLTGCDNLLVLDPSDVILLDPTVERGAPGRIIGRVVDEQATNRGLSDVEVTMLGPRPAGTVTDARGRFILGDLEPGLVEVQFTHLGFAPRTATLTVHSGRTVEVNARLSTQPIELEGIEVTVRSAYLERKGFYQRAQRFGKQFTSDDMDALNAITVSDLLWRVPGVSSRQGPNGAQAVNTLRRTASTPDGCVMPVYLDDARMFDFDINLLSTWSLDAMEVYTSANTPAQYSGGLGACGVILLWTKY